MVNKKLFLFDFDGTIANSLAAAVEAFNIVGPKLGCKPVDTKSLPKLLQGKSEDLMREHNLARWKLPLLVLGVRRRLKQKLGDIHPQPGMIEVLRELKRRGVKVGIVTTNSETNVDRFFAQHAVSDVYDFVVSYLHIFGKHAALTQVLKHEHLNPAQAVYIGDEVRDIEAAKRAGILSVAVTWGFQPQTTLEAAKPDGLVSTPSQLLEDNF